MAGPGGVSMIPETKAPPEDPAALRILSQILARRPQAIVVQLDSR